jgi:Calx-beta domain
MRGTPRRGRAVCVALLLAATALWSAAPASAAKPVASIADTTVVEPEGPGDTVKAKFTVTLSKKATSKVKVGYDSGSGTATPGDYEGDSGKITIKRDKQKAKIKIVVNGDDEVEGDESFNMTIYKAKGVKIDPLAGSASATITDSD